MGRVKKKNEINEKKNKRIHRKIRVKRIMTSQH